MNEPYQRRELEQRLSEPPGSLSDDLPLAARKLFYLERRNLLLLESELLKVRHGGGTHAAVLRSLVMLSKELICVFYLGQDGLSHAFM